METTTESDVTRIVATVESDLDQKLADLERRVAAIEAGAPSFRAAEGGDGRTGAPSFHAVEGGGRKTLPTTTTTLLAKQGVSVDTIEAGALDAALASLSLEQRLAVKAQLLRAGLLG